MKDCFILLIIRKEKTDESNTGVKIENIVFGKSIIVNNKNNIINSKCIADKFLFNNPSLNLDIIIGEPLSEINKQIVL